MSQFSFSDPLTLRDVDDIAQIGISAEKYIAHFDPFYTECRAYDRIKDKKAEDVAVHCYGYMIILAEREQELQALTGYRKTTISRHC